MAGRKRVGSRTSTIDASAAAGSIAPIPSRAAEAPRQSGRVTIEITDAMRADVRRFAEIGTPYAIIARIMGMSATTPKRRCRAELDAESR